MSMDRLFREYVYLQCSPDEINIVHENLEADFCRCFDIIEMMRERAENDLSVFSGETLLQERPVSEIEEGDSVPAYMRSVHQVPRKMMSFLDDFRRKVEDFINEGEDDDEDSVSDAELIRQEPVCSSVEKGGSVAASDFMSWLNDYLATDG